MKNLSRLAITVFILLVTLTLTIVVGKPSVNRMIMTGLAAATYIEPPNYDYIRLPTTFLTEEFMERTGFNPDHARNENWNFGYLPHGAQLTADEQATIEILNEDLFRHNLFDRETLEVIPTQEVSRAMMETTTLAVQESYHTYEDLYFQVKTWANDNPKMQMYTAGNAWVNIACPDGDHPIVGSDCRRQMWFMRISTAPNVTSNKPMIIMEANIHGDEVIGREMIIRLIDLFDLVSTNGATWCKQNGCAGADDTTVDMVNHLLSNAEILLMPSLNPDGNFYDKRQNCNTASSTDHNTCYSGKDLNRDFPQPERGDADSSSDRALETKHIMDKLFKLKPETYDGSQVELAHPFLTSISYHAGIRSINMPYADCTNSGGSTTSGCAANYPNNGGIFPEDLHVKSMNREYINLNSWIYTSSSGFNGLNYGYDMYPPLSGTSKDWIVVYMDAYDTVPELTSTKRPIFNANNEGVLDQWEYNRKSMVTWLYRSTKGFHLDIKDNVGQPVYGTTVTSNNRRLTYGDTNFIHRLGGRTVDPELMGYGTPELSYVGGTPVDTTGSFQVTIEKSGYETEVLLLTPEYFNGTFTQVTLTPEGGAVCPNNVREGAEVCDGTDLAGETCQSLGFDSGTLACLGDCSGFDTSACEQSTVQTFGVTNVGSSTSTRNNLRGMPFTMPEDGTIQSVTMYHTGGSGSMRLGVYSGEGSSATLLSQSAETPISGTTGWQEISLQTPLFVSGGQTVMLAWFYSNNPGIRYVTGSPGRWQRSLTWSGDGSMPDPFGSSSQSNYIYSIYATYTTVVPECPNGVRETGEVCDGTDLAGETCQSLGFDSGTLACLGDCSGFDTSACEQSTVQTFGVTNVGSSTSTRNNLRGMPFTMPEDGTIQSVTMYHTGGSGSMRLGVYSGEGSSATLLSQSAETPISGTTGWQEISLQTPLFVSGGQTVMLAWFYSNNPGIRYVTGSPGRWQRSLTWSGDGSMPDPFGSSSQSNYIYSIYATYNP